MWRWQLAAAGEGEEAQEQPAQCSKSRVVSCEQPQQDPPICLDLPPNELGHAAMRRSRASRAAAQASGRPTAVDEGRALDGLLHKVPDELVFKVAQLYAGPAAATKAVTPLRGRIITTSVQPPPGGPSLTSCSAGRRRWCLAPERRCCPAGPAVGNLPGPWRAQHPKTREHKLRFEGIEGETEEGAGAHFRWAPPAAGRAGALVGQVQGEISRGVSVGTYKACQVLTPTGVACTARASQVAMAWTDPYMSYKGTG